MSILSRLRHFFLSRHRHRHFSTSILSPDSTTPLSTKQKTRAAISLLKTEKNPERILDICRAASLTPDTHLDRVAFSIAISKLTAANHFDGIRRFIDELKTRPDLRNERFISHAIALFGQASMLDHAIRTFKETEDLNVNRSVKSLNSLLFAAIAAKNYKESFCESGSSGAVYSVLDEMDRKLVRPNATTLSTFIGGCYKEEKFEEVEKVLKLMEERYGMYPGLSTYNVRILSLCKLKKSKEAKALLEGMICRGRKPNSVSYSYLIHGFCKEGNFEEAKNLFSQMKKRGYLPDSDCYFTLVHYLCFGGDFESAFEVCKESMAKGWIPNFTTMKKVVNWLVSVEKFDDAKDLIKQIKGKFAANSDKWAEIEAAMPQ
ncbi:putative tetratricopeptide-like helical domain, pentacotripeptide-repeat region of PRORP [Lupinus albus]|uniref:Putative tetratricopeptide-like helical domain, pentacotripeptide-repeat region of PRORP n=1 Tax=Lupinus albus TaxID=3870 RepID=A0A6A4PA46_LUPAL|nr:putative tetratricopeptide-like helical domain, pentacotripeptide-repeat region of PRORP [Lupinus albus]